jgi:N-methylhydantoinase B
MKAATLAIYQHLFASVAEQMGVTLGRTALSPNIKERLDYSCCALFTGDGQLLAQAAHIPVHLGAMPASVKAALDRCQPYSPGDVTIVNDPYLGGTHLPDITLVSPVFGPQAAGDQDSTPVELSMMEPSFFVASRAHHADIGGMSPGSMPLSSELFQEGLIIPPIKIVEAGRRNEALWKLLLSNVRTPEERGGDFHAQLAANGIGQRRLVSMIERYGLDECLRQARNLIHYAERMTRAAIQQIPDGRYSFVDYLDNDGQSTNPLPIKVTVTVRGNELYFDFSGTASAVNGNLNAVPAIAISAVAYCLRCIALALLGIELPMNQGAIRPLAINLPEGSLLNPRRPYAVAAGNVETSQRIVDVVFGALASALPDLVPAASQGTMNNFTFGSLHDTAGMETPSEIDGDPQKTPFAYYETIGGGVGAGPAAAGGHGMHVHMSNTRNTPVEALEYSFPLRVAEYRLRQGSGGDGYRKGGDGLIRTIEFLAPARTTIVSERRDFPPYGLNGGRPGSPGSNTLLRDGRRSPLPGKVTLDLKPGDAIRLETPGGGGWGKSD